MPDTLLTTLDGERIRIMGDETVAHLLSVEHMENCLRAMGHTDLAGWVAQVQQEDVRAAALDYEDQQAAQDIL